MLKLHGCRKLKLKLVIGNLEENHISMDFSSLLSRTVPVIEEGPCEQRNQLFTVLGSLTDPEEEESKDSSEFSKRVLPRSEMVMVLETCHGNLLELEEMEGLEEWVLELGHGAGAGGRVIGVSARGGEAGGGEGDAGGGEAGASDGGLCGGCGGGATGLITGATFGAGGGETVGVTAGGGVIGDAGGGVAETGGTTVVGNGWNNCY
ncbi:unnamed protein product [Brassica napus]|uniref:(rape) hypothetical protein n=1 Tax=Brassica napus TaxID=3708 RepID=A0A816RMU1_BRANA|nr:unnamed protein product [Brassica napus]